MSVTKEQVLAALSKVPAPDGTPLPQARVLMSPGQHQPNAAFFTQLLAQTRF